jgi:diguanylate cyclase (GGDEF)-like protein
VVSQQPRFGGVPDPHAREGASVSDRPQAHLARLRALWDLALADDVPNMQTSVVLQEARVALGCDYVEVWDGPTRTRLFYSSEREPGRPIGGSGLWRDTTSDELALFSADDGEETPWRGILRSLEWSTVLARHFTAGGSRATLAFAWRNPCQTSVTEAELKYIDFLAHVVSRLIELADKQRAMNDMMFIDSLTGLHNRAATLDHIARMLSSAGRTGDKLAVFYVDLDGFKSINDTYGHAFGDKALAEAASRMRSALRRHEIAGRIGGDEFAVLVDYDDDTELGAIAERLLWKISQPVVFDNVQVRLQASVGIALYPQDGVTAEELLAHSDTAMYAVKRRRGAGYAFYGREEWTPHRHEPPPSPTPPPSYEPQASAAAPEESAPVIAPESVTERAERPFILCFQPIVDARTGRIIAAEALIRWLHPTLGLLLPSFPYEAGDAAGVPAHIDRNVMDSLLESDMYRNMAQVPIHVNISAASEDLFSGYAAARANLAVEVPESLVAEDPQRYAKFMSEIRDRGIGVGLSGFGGAGLALRYLADLQLDFVKIGPELIPGKTFNTGSPAAARAAIDQAHHFGWTVIAENVEDESQREWLGAAGVDALQGYYICSPLTQGDFANWLRYRGSETKRTSVRSLYGEAG